MVQKRLFIFTLLLMLIAAEMPAQKLVNPQEDYTWTLIQSGQSLGNPIDYRRNDHSVVYYGSVGSIYLSRDRGQSFTPIGTTIPNSTRVKNIILSEKDTLTFLVAIEASTDKIVKTTNSGNSWTVVADNLTFSYFGIPMTRDPAHPDTIYTQSNSTFMKSTDFGSTWTNVNTSMPLATPCDIEVFPDSTHIILIGDNTTGIFRSTNSGVTWSQVFTTSGEIPTIAVAKNKPGEAWATKWSGGGGLLKSTDYGATWTLVGFSGRNLWGVDVSPESADYVMTGEYSGGRIYLTKDGGLTWMTTTISSSNYSVVIADTFSIFAAQGAGFFKMNLPYPIPVELASFSGTSENGMINLSWITATETNNLGFDVEWSTDNSSFKRLGFVGGKGTTTSQSSYSYNFREPLAGKNWFRLKQMDHDGSFEYSNVIEVDFEVVKNFTLNQNYPNPFNPSTEISFSTPADGFASVEIYSASGELVAKIFDGNVKAGIQRINFDAAGLATGTYIYRVNYINNEGGKFSLSSKMLLLK
ncbi:MAG: T9SS type A sorting domain-containing protein [Ignavibacteriaceae bacterium]|nr:T9SS type A sorting domain-containing protein [Ignavibacteriaceae bacterium]